MDLQRLQDVFPPEDLGWRIARAGYTKAGKYYGIVLAYVTNRAIQHRLDSVCGPGNWRNEFREWQTGSRHGVLCGISIRIDGEWVTKWDGAENTSIEAVKGGLSDAMKRAGVQWGIGRYLYDLEENFAIVNEHGAHYANGVDRATGREYKFRWNPPSLPAWALPASRSSSAAVPAAPRLPGRREQHRPAADPVPAASKGYTPAKAPASMRP